MASRFSVPWSVQDFRLRPVRLPDQVPVLKLDPRLISPYSMELFAGWVVRASNSMKAVFASKGFMPPAMDAAVFPLPPQLSPHVKPLKTAVWESSTVVWLWVTSYGVIHPTGSKFLVEWQATTLPSRTAATVSTVSSLRSPQIKFVRAEWRAFVLVARAAS